MTCEDAVVYLSACTCGLCEACIEVMGSATSGGSNEGGRL